MFMVVDRPMSNEQKSELLITRTNLTCPQCGFVEELDIPLHA